MDERNKIISDDLDASKQQEILETKAERSNLGNRELDIVKDNEESCTELLPQQKNCGNAEKDNPANYLQEDKDECLEDRLDAVYSKENINECDKVIEHDDVHKLDSSSKKKINIRKTVVSYIRNILTNETGNMKNIKFLMRKGKVPKSLKLKSVAALEKENVTKTNDYDETSEDEIAETEFDVLEDSKPILLNTQTELVAQSGSSIESKDIIQPLNFNRAKFTSESKYVSEKNAQFSKVRSAEEVLEHFRSFMKSTSESLNIIKSEAITKEDTIHCSESTIQSPEDAVKTAKELIGQDSEDLKSDFQNLKDYNRSEMELTKTKSSKTFMHEKQSTQIEDSETRMKAIRSVPNDHLGTGMKTIRSGPSDNLETRMIATRSVSNDYSETRMKVTSNVPKQRIVYNERMEYIRGWIIQQIKDREILIQFKTMEGKLTKDVETKMQCIEEAEELQEVIDALFDVLEDTEKMVFSIGDSEDDSNSSQNSSSKASKRLPISPKRSKRYSNSPPKRSKRNLVSTERYSTERIRDIKWLKMNIKSLFSLFRHMYKFPSYVSGDETVFKMISLTTLMRTFAEFLATKIEHDGKSRTSENNANLAVDGFCSSLVQSKSKFKFEISSPEKESLDDYLTYINDLKMAINERFICLESLIHQMTSLLLPLMCYLSQSRKRTVNIIYFLRKVRLDLFCETSNENEAVDEDFCRIFLAKFGFTMT